ncbi:ribulose bisphosphate carboxylase small subunit [Thiohalorhabdus methylotrophus]|uniref:Ribulose bisphosphate carboxylase small subunit n=1 Tax=Thiohalorhabdus methylotrophus TaxID=3242694 RepID=A0ABV4TTS8_9GAMM
MAISDEMRDYRTKQTMETFGFLASFSWEQVYDQIDYLLAQGWAPAIEHEHPQDAFERYWTMWKLPMFGVQDLETVVQELEACHRAYPDHHVRLVGFDDYTQSLGTAFVVYEARG